MDLWHNKSKFQSKSCVSCDFFIELDGFLLFLIVLSLGLGSKAFGNYCGDSQPLGFAELRKLSQMAQFPEPPGPVPAIPVRHWKAGRADGAAKNPA